MAKKRGLPGKRKRPKSSKDNGSQQQEPSFFSPETEQTERDYTYKHPGAEALAAAIRRRLGNLSSVAQDLGISRTTLYSWIQDAPELEAVRKEANEARLDLAESMLEELIKGPVTFKQTPQGLTIEKRLPSYQAIQFLLRTQGRERGYVLNNLPIQSNDSASLWDQLHELLNQAREEFGDDP